MDASLLQSYNLSDWVLSLQYCGHHGLIAGLSNGNLAICSPEKSSKPLTKKAHDGAINKIRSFNSHTVCTCSNDATVKLWDLRQKECASESKNQYGAPFVSLDTGGDHLIASGTELKNHDSYLYIWDGRKMEKPTRILSKSHFDDITEVRFHPTRKNIMLSGSTDGYVNVYDLNITKEDDAILQTFNYASIHSANFITPSRIYALSHMETLAVTSMVDTTTEESVEPEPEDYGDVRKLWDCQYTVDVYGPGYICCGNSENQQLKIYRFDPARENFLEPDQCISLPGAHGNELVRDVCVRKGMIYTGGEDGYVKIWKAPMDVKDSSDKFFGLGAVHIHHKHHHLHLHKHHINSKLPGDRKR